MATNDDKARPEGTVTTPPATASRFEEAGRVVRGVAQAGGTLSRAYQDRWNLAGGVLHGAGADFTRGLGLPAPSRSNQALPRPAPAGTIPAAAATTTPKGMTTAAEPRPADVPPPTGMRFNEGRPTDAPIPTQPSLGYFVGRDDKRRSITAHQAQALASRLQTAPTGAATTPGVMAGAAQKAQVPVLQRPNAVALGRDAAAVQRSEGGRARNAALSALDPLGNRPAPSSELLRRIQHSQTSYFNKGSPQARNLEAMALMGIQSAALGADAARQQQVGQTVAGAATQEANLGAAAAEADAARADAQQARNLAATLQREQMDVSAPVLQLEGGTTARLGRDGVARSIVGEDGKKVRGQTDAKSLDPNEIFKAVTAAQQAILTDFNLTPEDRAAALQQLEATPGAQLVAALLSSPLGATASQAGAANIPPEAIQMLRSDPKSAAQFERTFNLPAGSAQQYLGN